MNRSLLASLICLLACHAGERDVIFNTTGPHGPTFTGASTSTGTTDTGTSDTSDPDTPGCDPLLDPLESCGPDLTCDLETLTCVPRSGTGAVDDLCDDDGACSPGLICVDGRCRALCDPEGPSSCSDGFLCTYAEAPIPGLCLEGCSLLDQICTEPEDACNRAVGPGPAAVAVCTANPGAGVDGDGCELDGDCSVGYLCTSARTHTLGCGPNAACCTPICDIVDLPCSGLEPSCYALGIVDQPSTGYCGS